jgi:sulfopyruvate decarboxylase TPP-binding subunit
MKLLQQHRGAYKENVEAAKQLVGVGQLSPPQTLDPAELAAWTHVARVLLNLHESITRS